MKINVVKSIATTFIVAAFTLSSCDKDELQNSGKSIMQTENIVTEGYVKNPIVINGKKQEWTFPSKHTKLSKGMLVNEAIYYAEINELLQEEYGRGYKLIDTLKFTYKNTKYSIRLLRVDRKSEPGKYFYVMIDNLNVKMDTACWAYADNERNVSKYGRLYTWHAANALAQEIKMKFVTFRASNPTDTLIRTKLDVKARLLSRQDVCDIIECDAIGHMPYNGYTIDAADNDATEKVHGMYELPLYYYDVFVGGLEGPIGDDPTDYSRGLHTLAGFRNTSQQPERFWNTWVNGWYTGLNNMSFIWLKDQEPLFGGDCHYPLEIDYNENYNYTAFINAEHWDQYGFSVRYVFEPRYK